MFKSDHRQQMQNRRCSVIISTLTCGVGVWVGVQCGTMYIYIELHSEQHIKNLCILRQLYVHG